MFYDTKTAATHLTPSPKTSPNSNRIYILDVTLPESIF